MENKKDGAQISPWVFLWAPLIIVLWGMVYGLLLKSVP